MFSGGISGGKQPREEDAECSADSCLIHFFYFILNLNNMEWN
jgi:hypothetical protein